MMVDFVGVMNKVTGVTSLAFGCKSGFEAMHPLMIPQCKLDGLVYYERYEDIHRAIGREKEIKGWLRIRKIAVE